MDVMEEVVLQKTQEFTSTEDPTEWRMRSLADWVNLNFPLGVAEEELLQLARGGDQAPAPNSVYAELTPAQFGVCLRITEDVRKAYQLKIECETNADALRAVERRTILDAIDRLWQEHLYNMDGLRNSIGLRAYGQRDPLIEYKAEAFTLFEELMVNIKTEICHNIFRSASSLMAFQNFMRRMPQRAEYPTAASPFASPPPTEDPAAQATKPSDVVSEAAEVLSKARPVRSGPKVGRNDPCPCGSGKKFKQCCGREH
jgi:preprotein translocase subunit SecA